MMNCEIRRPRETGRGLRERLALPPDALGDPRILVAVLDGSIDLEHPSLRGAALRRAEWRHDPGGDDGGVTASSHGTHLASLIFGQPGSPVEGIAPRCSGLLFSIYRGPAERPHCSQAELAAAIRAAMEARADVINISGGLPLTEEAVDPDLVDAIDACAQRGVLVFAAAGNDACDCEHLPAAIAQAIPIGAMDDAGAPLLSSNWGAPYRRRGLLALGADVEGAIPGGGLARQWGTSVATAIASGIAAVLLSRLLALDLPRNGAAVLRALLHSSIGCEEQPWPHCDRLLAGRLNVEGAFALVSHSPDRRSPMSAIEPQSTTESEQGTAPLSPEIMPLPEDAPAEIAPSMCGECAARTAPAPATRHEPVKAYVIGQIGYDFGHRTRRESLVQAGLVHPHDPASLLQFLAERPWCAENLIWLIVHDDQPLYALRPVGAYAPHTYELLRRFLDQQQKGEAERVSIPGYVNGSAVLENGDTVPLIMPDPRGMYAWTTAKLLAVLRGGTRSAGGSPPDPAGTVENFLQRIYFEARNLGLSPQHRALNFVSTNALQVSEIYAHAIAEGFELDCITVEPSPLTRPRAELWDVKLTFFQPAHRLDRARRVYRFTVDVSDVVPVTVGAFRQWSVY